MQRMLKGGRPIFSRLYRLTTAIVASAVLIAVAASADPETTLYSFTGLDDGGYSGGAAAVDSSGNVYTTGSQEGANGTGTIVELSPVAGLGPTSGADTETTLHTFSATAGNTDGQYPYCGLVMGKDGDLYGVTYNGGANGFGTIFKLALSGSSAPVFSVVYTFAAADPNNPSIAMVQGPDVDGTFYGVGMTDGADTYGGVFSFNPVTDVFTDIYDFPAAASSGGVAVGPDGSIYGTDDFGNGLAFRLTPGDAGNYSYGTIYTFTGLTDGGGPQGAVALGPDGSLYGAAGVDGVYGNGTLYRLTLASDSGPDGPSYDFSVAHSFDSQDGNYSFGGVTIGPDGTIYGTCYLGGTFDHGTVFKYTTAGGFVLLHSFTASETPPNTDGYSPFAPVTIANGEIFGDTYYGGSDGAGTVFELGTTNPPASILWQNTSTGSIYLWNMSFSDEDGYQLVSYPYVATVPDTTWQIAGAGDIDQEGVDDLIWHNSVSGDLCDWIMQSDPILGYTLQTSDSNGYIDDIGKVPDTNWNVAAVSDINYDGVPDLIWQNSSTGLTYDWIMDTDDDNVQISSASEIAAIAPVWHIEASADIDGDDIPDLIWRNTATGDVYWWSMSYDPVANTYSYNSYSYVATVPDLDFKIVGCADINGDGIPDLLWQNTKTGAVYYWLMALNQSTGAYTMTSYAQLTTFDPTLATSWRVAAFGIQTAGPTIEQE